MFSIVARLRDGARRSVCDVISMWMPAERPWLAGTQPTLADFANYAYVARAPEGNVSLQDYPALRAWLQRIEALPGFVPFAQSPVGLCA